MTKEGSSERQVLRAILVALFIVFCAASTFGVEHPGSLPRDAECSSCHAKKITGKSVHSAMETSCTVCHVTATQGDMTTMILLMPKDKICYACHAESAALRQHVPQTKQKCLECHDAHSSNARMLLRAEAIPSSLLKEK